ncbi:FACT complex subunit SSRP1 [Halotydeus destructor]|nr:FACT complex subunit SSRP1 [Halotydeus destructor]
MADFLEFNDISKEDRGALQPGRFKITAQGIAFKNSKTGKLDQLQGHDIQSIHWQRIASAHGFRVMTKNGNIYRFGGFNETDQDKVSSFFKHQFDISVREKDFSLKGWNWGVANFQGASLSFDVDKSSTAFEIPLTNVSHCTSAKNEVTLEFHQNDDAPVALMELRFHIPNPVDSTEDPVQLFLEKVLARADIIQATGDAIATFAELQCLTPRGRYDIKLYPTFIQLHGKTFDYKIPLTTVLRLFRLPHKDGRQVYFVLSLDPPIRQGQTRYHFLILLFNKDEETKIDLNIKDVRDKFDDKIDSTVEGSTVDVLSKVMKLLVQRKITHPSETFGGKMPVITCSYKANAGLLYPLDRGFIYVHKPPVHVRFEEIASVNFARSGGSTRSFDFEIECKSGLVHTFSSIEKDEYGKLYDFVANKKLRVKNTGTQGGTTKQAENDDLVDSDDEDEPDAYLARVKQEARERVEDSDESDDDFNPEKEESDVAEEFDSDASESESGSEAGSGDSPKKAKKKEKKEKKKKKEKKEKSKPKEKKHRKKKDADDGKPKKPMTAYFLWMNENRPVLKEKYPSLSLTELTKKAGELWKEKTSSDKTKYEEEYERLKIEYKKAMAEYESQGGAAAASSSKSSSKKEKSSSSSKKPSSSKAKESSPSKSASFKSKEFIDSDDDSSSDAGSEKKSKSKKEKRSPKEKKGKKKQESDEEMESAVSTPASEEDSD